MMERKTDWFFASLAVITIIAVGVLVYLGFSEIKAQQTEIVALREAISALEAAPGTEETPGSVPSLPGKSLNDYDFTTPQRAIASLLEIHAMGDIRAQMELELAKQMLDRDSRLRDLKSLRCERVLSCEGKVVVLFTYDDGGIPQYETQWFEKRQGRYWPTYVATYAWADDTGDKKTVHDLITSWESQDQPSLP